MKIKTKKASALCFVVITLIILTILGYGILNAGYNIGRQSNIIKNEFAATLAAEAGYEKAIFWMSRQPDLLSELQQNGFTPQSLSFTDSNCEYTVSLDSFVQSRPIYRIVSNGHSNNSNRTVDVLMLQMIGGWEMGSCRIPSGPTSTTAVNFISGEIIDMPLHINCFGQPDDSERDIYISGTPDFLQKVTMGESRYSAGGLDKYGSLMELFNGGIYFDQPACRVTDKAAIQRKADAFKAVVQQQKPDLIFTPIANSNTSIPNKQAAVQLEFYIGSDGQGYVQITKDCTLRGVDANPRSDKTYDYYIDPAGDGTTYKQYNIYGYHYIPSDASKRTRRTIASIQVTPSYGGITGQPEGRIFVNGNVIIGSKDKDEMPYSSPLRSSSAKINTVKGKVTVVATKNIWIANEIKVDGARDSQGMPTSDNPNVLGLVAQGVIKVVNPGKVEALVVNGSVPSISAAAYEPIGKRDSGYSANTYHRHLPAETVIEAALTVGGGGWGAEDVDRGEGDETKSGSGRKEAPGVSGNQDTLIVRGSISEAIRGVVGKTNADGYIKQYYLDERMLQGILPGDIWLRGKYIPVPGGWRDYRSVQ